jgi:hypothetical protein
MAFAHTLGEASVEQDASHAHVDAIRQDISEHVRASSSRSRGLNALTRTLEECAVLLYVQETDLEVGEVILAKELKCDLYPPDGRDLSAELDKAYTSVDRTAGDSAAKVEGLSWHIMLVAGDLGLLPIDVIPQLSKTAREVLPVVAIILRCLDEALASDAN